MSNRDEPTTTTPPARRSWRRRLAALGLASLGAFVVGELATRVLVGSPLPERLPILEVTGHPTRGWEMIPGEHYTYMHRVQVNSHGLRGPEIEPKAESELRVMVVGDSLIYGQGVAESDTLPAQLERELQRRFDDRPISVINAGLRAYATHQELALVEHLGPELQPDLVLLCWYWNDFDEPDVKRYSDRLDRIGKIAFDVRWPLEGRRLWKWRAMQLARRSALVMFVYDQVMARRRPPFAEERIALGLEKLEGYLAGFRAVTEQLGADFELVVMPDAASMRGPSEGFSITRRAVDVIRDAGIEPFDPSAALREHFAADKPAPLVPFDGHYDAVGNGLLVETLAPHVEERLRQR